MLPWLPPSPIQFPPVATALRDPDGLLAAGGELSADWLLAAYRRGIFPWYGEDQPLLWWSPDPRMVLFPGDIRIRRSLAKRLRNAEFTVSFDRAFADVIEACASVRQNAEGTWIDSAMRTAYCHLHRLGYAHSVEVWEREKLVGGLYGLSLGRIFFGESMFSLRPDASKIALVHLARHLEHHDFTLIDCQMHTPHLASLGAHDIARETFLDYVERSVDSPHSAPVWPKEVL